MSSVEPEKGYFQLEVPVARFQAKATCQDEPFQYSESLARWISTSTMFRPAPPVSEAFPQMSSIEGVEHPAVYEAEVSVVPPRGKDTEDDGAVAS